MGLLSKMYRGAVRGATAFDRNASALGKYAIGASALGGGIGAGAGALMEYNEPNGRPMEGAIGGGLTGAALGAPVIVPTLAIGAAAPPLAGPGIVGSVLGIGAGASHAREQRNEQLSNIAAAAAMRGADMNVIKAELMRHGASPQDIPVAIELARKKLYGVSSMSQQEGY